MGLDFTDIPDRTGAACYIIHHNTSIDTQRFESLQSEINKLAEGHQIILIDAESADGQNICDFYDITPEQLPAIMIVKDDDSIAYSWIGLDVPAADVIAYNLQQVSA